MEQVGEVNAMEAEMDEEGPLTPYEIARKEQIALGEELIERTKEFHKLTAAFVMDLENYQRVRRILSQEEPPLGGWEPVNGDMLSGYPIVIREDGGAPHVELVDKPLRPSHFAGVTSIGIERPMEEPPFADPLALGGFSETEPAPSVHSGHEEEEAHDDTAPAPESRRVTDKAARPGNGIRGWLNSAKRR